MKTLAHLVVPFQLKADADISTRTFEGLAATWDLDLGNDVIKKGAFKNTLKNWKSSGEALPLLNSHDHFDIFSAIGQMVDAKENDEGLWTKWEVIDGPEGDAVLARLRKSKVTKRPLIGKMSIGYDPVKWEFEQPEGTDSFFDRIRHLNELNLKEVSLVLFPMQPGASIDASSVKYFIKSAQATDPAKLTVEVKLELRKLASRIGILLKNTKKPKDAKDDTDLEEEDTDLLDTTTPPAAPPVIPPVETDDEADTDGTDSDDEGEETDESVETPKSTATPPDSKAGAYLYADALQQRLRARLLKNKTEELKQH